jgi:hypothetical protein
VKTKANYLVAGVAAGRSRILKVRIANDTELKKLGINRGYLTKVKVDKAQAVAGRFHPPPVSLTISWKGCLSITIPFRRLIWITCIAGRQ